MLNVHIKRTIGRPGAPAQQLLEVVTPLTNAALISPAEHLCGSLTVQTRGPGGCPAVRQVLLLEPAPANWARGYQRLALEHPIQAERAGRGDAGASLSSLATIVVLAAAAAVGLNAWSAWQRGDWGTVALTAIGLLTVAGLGLAAYLRFGRRELHDPKLVQEKLRREACRTELRLAVIAPGHARPETVQARPDRLAAAHRPFAPA